MLKTLYKIESRQLPLVVIISALLMAPAISSGDADQATRWSRVMRLSANYSVPPDVGKPALAVDSSARLHLVWADTTGDPDARILRYLKVDGAEKKLFEKILKTENPPSWPTLVLDGRGTVNIFWTEESKGGGQRIVHTRLDDASGHPPERNLTSYSPTADQVVARIDAGGNFHLIWRGGGSGSVRLRHLALSDGMEALGREVEVTNGTFVASSTFALDSRGDAHIAYWERGEGLWALRYAVLDTSSGRVRRVSNLGTSLTLRDQNRPDIALDPKGGAYIFWMEELGGGGSRVVYAVFDGEGRKVKEAALGGYRSGWPSVDIDSRGRMRVAWTDWRGGRMEVYYAEVDHTTGELSGTESVSKTAPASWLPTITTDREGYIHLLWLEFLRDGLRVSYRNTRWPAEATPLTELMDAYGFQSEADLVKGLLASTAASVMVAPLLLASPAVILVVLSVAAARRLVGHPALGRYFERPGRLPPTLLATMASAKLVAVALELPLTYSRSYQLVASTFSIGSALAIRRWRGARASDPMKWTRTAVVAGLFDGFVTSFPYVLAFLSGF